MPRDSSIESESDAATNYSDSANDDVDSSDSAQSSRSSTSNDKCDYNKMFLVPQKIYKSLHKKYAKTKIGKLMKKANLKLGAKMPPAKVKRNKTRAPRRQPTTLKGPRRKGTSHRRTNKKIKKQTRKENDDIFGVK